MQTESNLLIDACIGWFKSWNGRFKAWECWNKACVAWFKAWAEGAIFTVSIPNDILSQCSISKLHKAVNNSNRLQEASQSLWQKRQCKRKARNEQTWPTDGQHVACRRVTFTFSTVSSIQFSSIYRVMKKARESMADCKNGLECSSVIHGLHVKPLLVWNLIHGLLISPQWFAHYPLMGMNDKSWFAGFT